MRALGYLLGARALDLAQRQSPRRRHREPDFAPIASTPALARAWRAWAEAGRLNAGAGGRPIRDARPVPAPGRIASRQRHVAGGGAA